ncbi:MAG: BrnT family toxin [Propionibacteriaceae bacterium]|jgi:uncharacterized DUF497 family protein|nr:BrnT family toxin [Propionibacteriaceae bacterium]
MGGRGTEVSGLPDEPDPLRFEWDPNKSASNKLKHGVDFEQAKVIWNDPGRFRMPVRYTENEERFATIGLIDGRMYTAITTDRNGVIRIISVRRARRGEEKLHDQ